MNYIFDAIFLADERGLSNLSVIFFGCHLAVSCKEGYLLLFVRCFAQESMPSWKEIQGRKYREEKRNKHRPLADTCFVFS